MPRGTVPARFQDLLTGTALGNLATVTAGGLPQVNPVWFISDGTMLYLSVKPDTVKYRNMRANPRVAMSVSDPDNPGRYVELRGEVVAFEYFDSLRWVNELARKYTGGDFTLGRDGEDRYKVTIQVTDWTAQG